MTGELFINGKDAYTQWGVTLEDGALSALMTPAAQKDRVENEVRTLHGKTVYRHLARLASRDLTLPIHINARTKTEFYTRYNAFCEDVLKGGTVEIETVYQPDVLYRCLYQSCNQFSQFMETYAAFQLKLIEPDPTNREKTSV